ncbi:hypothetical protein PtA15_10A58 [Puccinia triticina]|uniref:Uncharacterized protein n=1 Tax=Puccinia triticina TaxID=208348 RepID=A0ABY7CTQ3_9BASI|nr:uncharacterized protein PtA15_10A58 [Puccinia triticina]WAQ88639.1 hypothetical protein PtA15_10A58 [Puccinia triticina]
MSACADKKHSDTENPLYYSGDNGNVEQPLRAHFKNNGDRAVGVPTPEEPLAAYRVSDYGAGPRAEGRLGFACDLAFWLSFEAVLGENPRLNYRWRAATRHKVCRHTLHLWTTSPHCARFPLEKEAAHCCTLEFCC